MASMILKINLQKNREFERHSITCLREDLSIRLEDALLRTNIGRWIDDLQTSEGIVIFFEVTDYIEGLRLIESTFRNHRLYPLIKVAQQAA